MKPRHLFTLMLGLALAFFTAQSFLNRKGIATAIVQPYRAHVVVCASPYVDADSAINIPALKGWGNYKFKISNASDSAQFYFNQGLSLYYAFHSIEAIASFTKATHLDPNCAMAWYGKALAMGPTINYDNGYLPPTGAYEAAIRSSSFSRNGTPLEKDLISAIQQRYRPDSTISIKQLRKNYADAMEKVSKKYPDNADVLTLYADALLLLHPWDLYDHEFKAKPWTPLIRTVLEKALKICPAHPGANHYYIHTMEASATPQMALKSANILDTLMPLVSHITHMPSHIYIRTGYYQRGIKVNDAALAGYNNYIKQYAPIVNGSFLYELHNIHLKTNCAQMAGNYKTSIAGSQTLQSSTKDYLSLPGAMGNLIQYVYMEPTFTAVRFGKWDDVLKVKPLDTLVYASLLRHFARGMAYCVKGNPAMAKAELKKLNERIDDRSLKLNMDNFSSAYDAACVARLLLQGRIAEAQKQFAVAIDLLQKAVTAEDHVIYNEPRDWPLPTRQYLANALIKAGKYDQAIAVLNKDLMINPNNGWSLTGLQMIYQKKHSVNGMNEVQQQLTNAWEIKDVAIDNPVF